MKLVVLCTLFLLIFVHVECRPKYQPEERCTSELHLPRGRMKGIINEPNTPEDNVTYGEFIFCVFKKRAIMADDGIISDAGLQNFLQLIFLDGRSDNETIRSSLGRVQQACLASQTGNKFKTAVRLKNCIAKYVQELAPEL